MSGLLWAIIALLLLFWLFGFTVAHLSSTVHVLLVLAVLVVAVNLLTGRRRLI